MQKTGYKFRLFKGDTVCIIPEVIRELPKMDLIFIDGGKSCGEGKSDREHSKTLMHDKTAVFVHNYRFSGVRKTVDNISRDNFKIRIIHPSNDSDTALIIKN